MISTKFRPPFSWLGSHTSIISLVAIIAIGAYFRFYQLNTLPPGLDETSARVGLQALQLVNQGHLPDMNAVNVYAPIWTYLQALSVKIFGATEFALRLWPALLGTLTILTIWLWTRAWFGLRIAWFSAFLVAVSPWTVTLSRSGFMTTLYPLLITTTLWLATRAHRHPGTGSYVGLAIVLVLNLLAGPIGWLLATTILAISLGVLAQRRQILLFDRARIISLSILVFGLTVFSYLAITSSANFKGFMSSIGLTNDIGLIGSNFIKTLLMFHVYGDENYLHNLAGQPLLNAFIGIMLIAGLLVGISRLHRKTYVFLYIFLAIFLTPALLSVHGAPNAARAFVIMPFILTLAAIGISYFLELWYATFPINSAARTIGQTVIIILLGLTLFQGYTQYFRAWASSSEMHLAYNEAAVEIAHRLKNDKFSGQRFIIATPIQQPVIAFLNNNQISYKSLQPGDIMSLPIGPGSRQFTMIGSLRDPAMKTLKTKFPGGVLRPHYSDFNQTEIYYTYEVTTK